MYAQREEILAFEYRLVIGKRENKGQDETKWLYPEGTDLDCIEVNLFV